MQVNCPPDSGGQRHRVLCDDARGGSPNEMFQNAFLKSPALEPPPARSRLLSRSCCPPDSGGQFAWIRHLPYPTMHETHANPWFHESGADYFGQHSLSRRGERSDLPSMLLTQRERVARSAG